MAELPTEDDLKKLSLRAMVAYAARCARRVQPLLRSAKQKHVEAVEGTISMAERFAKGHDIGADTAARVADEAAAAADHAAAAAYYGHSAFAEASAAARHDDARHTHLTAYVEYADAAYTNAAHAAAEAEAAPDHAAARAAVVQASRRDYTQLLSLTGNAAGQLGDPIDFDKLGPLWPKGMRVTLIKRGAALEMFIHEELMPPEHADRPGRTLSIIVDDSVDPTELAGFLAELSAIYSELSDGDELVIREGKVPVGVEVGTKP